MINLIKNEFIKVFKKKSIYIILIITIGFIIFANFMYKNTDNNMYYNGYDAELIKSYEDSMPSPDDPKNNTMYIDMKAQLDYMNLMEKYSFDSWQGHVLQRSSDINNLLHIIAEYEYSLKQTVSEQEYLTAKQDYDSFIQKLESDDWRYFVSSELKDINQEIEFLKQSNVNTDSNSFQQAQIQKQILEWRLEKGISYDRSFLNTCLEQYENSFSTIYSYEHSNNHSYSEKQDYYEALEKLNENKYYIENNIQNISSNDNRGILLNLANEYELFILIFTIMIAGSIVSDEFNKGTIKLLLVRPYSRAKILLSKFIVCMIILILFIAVIGITQFILGGIIQGFDSVTVPAVIYNHNTNQIQTMNIFSYMVISILAKLPVYILLMTLAFACSTIFINTAVSIVLPLLGYMASSLLNQLALAYNIKAILYFVTPNWDFTNYLWGGLPMFEQLTIPFSIVICIIYFMIMMITSFIVFKRRNIKNI